MLWHSRPEAVCSIDRDLIWQIYRRPNQGCGKGRRQHHPTRAWIDKVKAGRLNLSPERIKLMKMIVDDSGVSVNDRAVDIYTSLSRYAYDRDPRMTRLTSRSFSAAQRHPRTIVGISKVSAPKRSRIPRQPSPFGQVAQLRCNVAVCETFSTTI